MGSPSAPTASHTPEKGLRQCIVIMGLHRQPLSITVHLGGWWTIGKVLEHQRAEATPNQRKRRSTKFRVKIMIIPVKILELIFKQMV